MSERIGPAFRGMLVGVALFGALTIAAATALVARGALFNGLLIGGVALLLLQWFWRATARRRALSRIGFFTGSRFGNHWRYEELHHGTVESLDLLLEYHGRGEYGLHIPGERDWVAGMPDWARGRRDEIVARLQTVFKHSQMHFDPDSAQSPAAQG